MKKSIFLGLVAISMLLVFSACNNRATTNSDTEASVAEAAVYTCPMHPEVQRDQPGDCPVCGMPLVIEESSDTTGMHMTGDSMHMQ